MRRKLTYANVMATLAVFVALGGASYAALKLPKNSVGTKQLKKNAVTTKKIKSSSVNGAKVKNASLSGADIRDGSLTGSDVNAASMPFARIVHRARGNATMEVTSEPQIYPLDSPTYTQGANEDDSYSGAVDVTMSSGCEAPRNVIAFVAVDAADPTMLKPQEIGAVGSFYDPGTGNVSGRLEIGAGSLDPGRFETGAPTNHTLSLVLQGHCTSGSGISASFGGVDVIGVTP
jgi:hypothetical protein